VAFAGVTCLRWACGGSAANLLGVCVKAGGEARRKYREVPGTGGCCGFAEPRRALQVGRANPERGHTEN
jgi:hypothetical protein